MEITNLFENIGPIRSSKMIPVVDREGIRVEADVPVIKSDETGWRGQWIWLSDRDFPDDQTCRATTFCAQEQNRFTVAVFRKIVEIKVAPSNVLARVSADTKYRLYVNGQLVGRGPAEVGGDYGNTQSPDWWFYETYDLAEYFKAGQNIIATEVVLSPMVQADYSMGRGGFLFDAVACDSNGTETLIITDAGWRARRNDAWVSPDNYDSRKEIGEWTLANYDDSSWPAVQVIAGATEGPWNLLPREIPLLMETAVLPVEVIPPGGRSFRRIENPEALTGRASVPMWVRPGSSVTFHLRFERELAGYIQFCVNAAADTTLNLQYQEVAGRTNRREQYILRDGIQSVEGLKLQAFENLQVTVTFPKECKTSLEIYLFALNFISFPVRYRGQFACSDETLNKIWSAGRWTTQLCMQAYHLDSPIHQEGLGCTGDYRIESLISYYAFGEARLARQDILRTSWLLKQNNFRMFHTSYSLLWVHMLHDYWFQTGDVETVKNVLPIVHGLLDRFSSYVGRTGLVTEAPDYMFMDWGPVGEFDMHHPPCVIGQGYMSAFYFKALEYAAELGSLVGENDCQNDYRLRAQHLKEAFNRELWDEEKGLFCDGRPFVTGISSSDWLPADVDHIFYSRHTNAIAVAYGLAPENSRQDILNRAMNDQTLPTVQPYFMHYIFEALSQAGLFERYGLNEIRKWKTILDEHPSSLKECWDTGDYSHAWSGTPTIQLSSRVLGALPILPGWKAVRICPQVADLTWAKGTIPSPMGDIDLAWQKTPETFELEVTLPDTMKAEIWLPHCDMKNVRVLEQSIAIWQSGSMMQSNKRISDVSENGKYILIKTLGGKYHFIVEPD